MNAALILLAAALPALAADLGGHAPPDGPAVAAPADRRRVTLDELWQRGLLPPDQSAWAPADEELLGKIRRVEKDAISYLKRKPGGTRPWVARSRGSKSGAPALLTRAGYERYMDLAAQDAIAFFESKGVDAKWVFKLVDMDDKPLFDGAGRLTEEGSSVYRRAAVNAEVYWQGVDGQKYGTRRPDKIP